MPIGVLCALSEPYSRMSPSKRSTHSLGVLVTTQILLFISITCNVLSVFYAPWLAQDWILVRTTAKVYTWVMTLWNIKSQCDCTIRTDGALNAGNEKVFYVCMGVFKPAHGSYSSVQSTLCGLKYGRIPTQYLTDQTTPTEHVDTITRFGGFACPAITDIHNKIFAVRVIGIIILVLTIVAIVAFVLFTCCNLRPKRLFITFIVCLVIALLLYIFCLAYFGVESANFHKVFGYFPDSGIEVNPIGHGDFGFGYYLSLLAAISIAVLLVTWCCVRPSRKWGPDFDMDSSEGYTPQPKKQTFWAFTPAQTHMNAPPRPPPMHPMHMGPPPPPQYGTVPPPPHPHHL